MGPAHHARSASLHDACAIQQRDEALVQDPVVFTQPWKVAFPLRRNPDYRIYEYTCHEHNYALLNFIKGSQFQRAQKPKG